MADVMNEVFRRGLGVATASELRDSGMSKDILRRLLRKGTVTAVLRGVYAPTALMDSLAGDPARLNALLAAAAIKRAPDLVASHATAALIHGLDLLAEPGLTPRAAVLTKPAGGVGHSSRRGIPIHVAALPDAHVTKQYGVPVTTVARTVSDIARGSTFHAGVVTADSAMRLGLANNELLVETARECTGWPGSVNAVRVAEFASDGSESAFESVSRAVFDEHGLEPPSLQFEVSGPAGYIGRVDFCWPAYRTIAEADGSVKYENPDQARRQLFRDQMLREAGWHVVHFSWRQILDEPERVITWIRSAPAWPTSLA